MIERLKLWWQGREICNGQIIPYGVSWSLNMDGVKRFGFRKMYAIRLPLFFVRKVKGAPHYAGPKVWMFQQLELLMEIGWRRNEWPGSVGANFASRWMFAWAEIDDQHRLLDSPVYYKESY